MPLPPAAFAYRTCHSPARSQADMTLEKLTTSGVRPLVLMPISRPSACSHLQEAAPMCEKVRHKPICIIIP